MAFSFNNKKSNKKQPLSEINITPFVDVLLVLLIIFIVAAPMMNSSVNLNLPKGATMPIDNKIESISVSVKSDGTIFLQDNPIRISDLSKKLLKLTNEDLSHKIHIRADKNLDYGKVMEVVRIVNLSGFSQVILVTELTQ